MTAEQVPEVYLFSNVTLGYGSPKYTYFLKMLENRQHRTHTIEPYESIRPAYPIEGLRADRRVVGAAILDSWFGRKLQQSFKLNKYAFLPLRKFFLGLAVLRVICLSYRKPILVVTTYDSPLFTFFSQKTTIVQNFSEIWPTSPKSIATSYLRNYRERVEVCISPQADRVTIAKSRYRNATHFLVHNAPPLGKPEPLPSKYEHIEVLYQGRLGEENYPLEFLALAENIASHIQLHIAGIVDDQLIEKLQAIEKKNGNITLHGYLNAPSLEALRSRCNIGIIAWDNATDNTKYAAPNKLYEHLQNGDSIVFFPNHSLNQLNAEFAFGTELRSGSDMANYLNSLNLQDVQTRGERNYQLYQSKLNFESQIEPVISYLSKRFEV